jgi:glycosyltransferase involved in cell wall biosynthesis
MIRLRWSWSRRPRTPLECDRQRRFRKFTGGSWRAATMTSTAPVAEERERVARPLRVLQILGSLDRGGVESRAIEILQALPQGVIEPHFLLLSGREGNLACIARSLGAEIHAIALTPRSVFRYRRLLSQIRPDVVHSHVHFSSGPFLTLAAWMRIPVRVAQIHSTTDIRQGRRETWRRRTRRRLCRWMIYWCATDVVAVSQSVLDANPGLRSRRGRARVLYEGIATSGLEDRLLEPDGRTPKIVQIGRLDPEKNQLFALEVVSELLRRGGMAELWMVGRSSGDYATRVEKRIEELGLGHAARLCGERSDILTSILPTAAAMLHPTRVEGLPGVILEALATGTPVVASDIPPDREVADQLDGVTLVGLDEPASRWVDALLPLLVTIPTKDDRLERLRVFRSSEFSLERYIPRLLALWTASGPD